MGRGCKELAPSVKEAMQYIMNCTIVEVEETVHLFEIGGFIINKCLKV